VLVTCVLVWLLGTRFGAVTEAIRDNEERARFIGIRTTVPRALVYALSAVVTGIAGLLSSLNTGFISPESLHWSVSAITLLMVVVGGFKRPIGPIVGAIVYFLFKDLLGEWATHSLALFGAALIAVIVFSPDGIVGAATKLRQRLRYGPLAKKEG
jgi:branched-chain amino acid transport system permease protein